MKNTVLLLFFSLILGIAFACSLPEQNNTILESTSTHQQDTADFPLIKVQQDSVWDAIIANWQQNNFNDCLKKYKLKISCGSCTSLFMDLVFYVDDNGKLVKHEVTRSKFCEKNEIEKCLLDYFYKLNFPSRFFNTSFEFRLGRGLKC